MNLSNALVPQVFTLEIGKLRQKLFLQKLITQDKTLMTQQLFEFSTMS